VQRPYVKYELDETIKKFIRETVGITTQHEMIASEILVGAGLASREMILRGSSLKMHIRSNLTLQERWKTIQNNLELESQSNRKAERT
jgi:hypothetical protein